MSEDSLERYGARRLAVIDGGDGAGLWDVSTHRLIAAALTKADDSAEVVAFSPDGRTLAFSDNIDHVYLCPVSGGSR
jgi:hypothetical protein